MLEQVNIANHLELSVYPDKGFIYVVDYYIEGIHYCPKTTESTIGRTMPINAVYEQAEGLTSTLASDYY